MTPRLINHDAEEMRFDQSLASLIALFRSVKHKQPWHWNNRGLVGVLTPEVLENGLSIYLNYASNKQRRVPIPPHAGRFFWAQTVPLQDGPSQLAETSPASQGEANK